MKSLFHGLILTVLIVSCNKEAGLNKKMDGQWAPHSLRLIESNGLSYYVDATGSITFTPDGKKSTVGSYTINISYTYNGSDSLLQESGTYSIEEDRVLRSYDGAENESRVVYINKEDLEFEIPNLNNRSFFFVLERL